MFIRVYRMRAIFALCLCVLCALIAACILIPVPAVPLNEVVIGEDTLAAIEVGRDSRDSVARLLGDPLLRSPDDSRWVYRTRIFDANKVQLCGGGPNWFGCARPGETQHEFLDISFGPDGTAGILAIASTEKTGCTDSGICAANQWPRAFALYDEPHPHDAPDRVTQDMCTVYAYLASDNPGSSFALQLGTDQTVWWVRQEDLVKAVVTPGARRLWAISYDELDSSLKWAGKEQGWSDAAMAAAPWASMDVDCGPGEVRYFELKFLPKERERIFEVENLRGKGEIAKRRELISMYVGEFPFVQPVTPGMKP